MKEVYPLTGWAAIQPMQVTHVCRDRDTLLVSTLTHLLVRPISFASFLRAATTASPLWETNKGRWR